jgi:outer membrane protein assembly factor BamB
MRTRRSPITRLVGVRLGRLALALGLLLGVPRVAGAWRLDLRDPGDDFPTAIAPASGGDVLVAATFGERFKGRCSVLRLRQVDGTVVWRQQPAQVAGRLSSVVSVGDGIVAEGRVIPPGEEFFRHVVLRLSAATGVEVWRDVGQGDAFGASSAVDARGDVVIARASSSQVEVRKLAGATGAELWRHTTPLAATSAVYGATLAVDSRGDVIVGTTGVEKLDGATGELVWSAPLPIDTYASSMKTDPSGDLVIEVKAQTFEPGYDGEELSKLDGVDGSLVWHRPAVTAARRLLDVDDRGGAVVANLVGGPVGQGLYARWQTTLMRLDATSGMRARSWSLGRLSAPVLLTADDLGSNGDVLASVVTGTFEGRPAVARVLRLRGRGRPVRWVRVLGRVPGLDEVPLMPRVMVGADGTIVAAWVRHRRSTGYDLRVVTFSDPSGPRS